MPRFTECRSPLPLKYLDKIHSSWSFKMLVVLTSVMPWGGRSHITVTYLPDRSSPGMDIQAERLSCCPSKKKKKAPLLRWWLGHFWSNSVTHGLCVDILGLGLLAFRRQAGITEEMQRRNDCLWRTARLGQPGHELLGGGSAQMHTARPALGVQQPHFCTAVRGSGCPLVTCWQAVQDPLFQHGFSSWLNSFWSCRSADPASS